VPCGVNGCSLVSSVLERDEGMRATLGWVCCYSSTSRGQDCPKAAGGKALRGDPTVGYDGTQAPCCTSVSAGGGPES